jgi:diguanylate cyclase (GGDEF)-like protein
MRNFVKNFLLPDFEGIPASERHVMRRAMGVAWIGTVAFAFVLASVEMGLDWATPEGWLRVGLRPVVFTCAAIMSTAMVMRASYRESGKFYREQTKLNEALAHQALFDALTDLPNRRQFHDHLEQSLHGARADDAGFALLMIDLDGFKDINDTYGHAVGDVFLQQVAVRLLGALRPTDIVARLGGDEFAAVLGAQPRESVLQVAQRLLDVLAQPVQHNGREIAVTASIGIALCPDHGSTGDLLLRRGDLAMYAAKRTGGRYAVYSEDLETAEYPTETALPAA